MMKKNNVPMNPKQKHIKNHDHEMKPNTSLTMISFFFIFKNPNLVKIFYVTYVVFIYRQIMGQQQKYCETR
jgi:hypothetical protein